MEDDKIVQVSEYVTPGSYQTLGYRARCQLTTPQRSQSFTAQVYIERDQLIYIKLLGVGIIKLGEALIKPDRIVVLDRINRRAYDKGYDYLQQLTGIALDYDNFQSILMGELPTQISGDAEILEDSVEITSTLSSIATARYTISISERVWKALYIQLSEGDLSEATLRFENYRTENGYMLSHRRTATLWMKDGEQQLSMVLSRYEIDDPRDISLNIPRSYRVEK